MGIGVLNVGHRAPEVVAAVHDQVDRFTHACFHVTPYEVYLRLAERLNQLAPIDGETKTFLTNSGAEGIENAVKIARAHTGRPAILCFEDGFHGRTLLALSLTSKITPYKAGMGPFALEVYRVPYAYCFRCSYNLSYPSCDILVPLIWRMRSGATSSRSRSPRLWWNRFSARAASWCHPPNTFKFSRKCAASMES